MESNPKTMIPVFLLCGLVLAAVPVAGVSNSGMTCEAYADSPSHEVCAEASGTAVVVANSECTSVPSGWDCVHFTTTAGGTADLDSVQVRWADDHVAGWCGGLFGVESSCSQGPVDAHKAYDDFDTICNQIDAVAVAPLIWQESAWVTVKVGNGC